MYSYRELSLRGNSLECSGCVELVKPLVALCAPDSSLVSDQRPTHTMHSDQSSASAEAVELVDGATKKEADTNFQPFPLQLARLYLQDNCIDMYGKSVMEGSFEPVVCARALKRYF